MNPIPESAPDQSGSNTAQLSLLNRRRCVFLATTAFISGLIPDNPLHWLSLLGWLPLFYLLYRANSFQELLWDALLINVIVAGAGFFWILFIEESRFLWALAYSGWFVLVFIGLLWGLKRYLMPIQTWFWPILCGLLWFAYVQADSLVVPVDLLLLGFFSFPDALLQSIHYLPYSVLTAVWVAFCASLMTLFCQIRGNLIQRIIFFLTVSLLLAGFIFGQSRLSKLANDSAQISNKKISVIQHNFPWDNQFDPLPELEKLAAEAKLAQPDLIIFPLYNLLKKDELELTDNNGFFSKLAQRLETPILIASQYHAPGLNPEGFRKHFYVTAFFYGRDGRLESTYHSVDRSVFHDHDQVLENQYHVMQTSLGRIGILLCYENIKSKWALEALKQNADILIGLSNPTDQPYSALPYYHLQYDRMRAIETGINFIRVSANGFSGWMDGLGRTQIRSQLRQRQILTFNVPLSSDSSK